MVDLSVQESMPRQGSAEWHKMRLGKFNASRISELMANGRGKEEHFGKSALSYIAEVAAERFINRNILDDEDLFWMYLELVGTSNKYMRFGSEHEYEARELYERAHGVTVVEVSSVEHPTVSDYSCSSDGLVESTNSGIEVKCPLPRTYVEYRAMIHDGDTLKSVRPEYYWQIQAQIDICMLDFVDFVAYCPFMDKPMHEARIMRNEKDINIIHTRVEEANKIIKEKYGIVRNH